MKRGISLCLGAAVMACGTILFSADPPVTQPAPPEVLKPAGDGWLPLFNGKDLSDWATEPKFWKLEEGNILHGTNPGTPDHHYMYSKKNFDNFEMHADVKLLGYNSGICIRLSPTSFDNVPGYQVDMGDGYWGCLWEEKGRGKVVDFPKAEADKILHKEDWNHYYFKAQGHHIVAWLNGTKTADVVDDKGPLTGVMGFQLAHGNKFTDAMFKNAVYRPLGETAK